ncbi:MAG: helix-turn-helix domain-containing protein [Treponema sp.]|nr:helix-turn-helix domain-containing protein [Treponema sp.]
MKTLTLDDIKLVLQNRNEEELKYFSVLLIPYINNILFSENASLIRTLSGLSLRQAAKTIDISGQALSQFEKKKEFPEDKIEKLLQVYLKIAVDLAFNGNKQLLNLYFTLFLFTTINYPLNLEELKLKEQNLKNLTEHINEAIYRENFIDEIDEYSFEQSHILRMSFIMGKESVYNFFYSNIYTNTKSSLTAISRNLKVIRLFLDIEQQEISELLGISNKTYSFYENNPSKFTLNAYDACKILSKLFDQIEGIKTYNENFKKRIKLLFIQKTSDTDNRIISETLYDYCIAIKYRQSQKTIDYLEKELEKIELLSVFNIPLDNETKQTVPDDTDENIFNETVKSFL